MFGLNSRYALTNATDVRRMTKTFAVLAETKFVKALKRQPVISNRQFLLALYKAGAEGL